MSWFLPRLVGIGQALEWTLSGRVFGADHPMEAHKVDSRDMPPFYPWWQAREFE